MRRPKLGTLLAIGACLIYIPAQALAVPQIGEHKNGFSITDETYLRTYEKCWKAFDSQCGRNIVDDGLSSGKPPPEQRVKESTATMQRWLAPAPEEEPATSSSTAIVAPAPATSVPAAPVTSSGACGGTTPYVGAGQCWAIPYEIVACESGGSYTASNPSGAYGAYQLMPEHGCGTSVAEQDACAADLYAGGAGRSNWVC